MTSRNFLSGAFVGVLAGIYLSQNYEVRVLFSVWTENDAYVGQVVDMKSFVNGLIKKMQEYEKNKRRDE